MADDTRSRLRLADELARQQKYADATALYQSVAHDYAVAGFALKAIAVSKGIVHIVDHYAPDLIDARVVALRRLAALYEALGLDAELDKTRQLLEAKDAV